MHVFSAQEMRRKIRRGIDSGTVPATIDFALIPQPSGALPLTNRSLLSNTHQRWPLAAGRWPLAAGRWPLAAGRWPLAAFARA